MGILQVQVVHFIPFYFNAPIKFILLLNLCPLIFSLTPFSKAFGYCQDSAELMAQNEAGSKLR
jgi:hypothetical protein